MEGKRACNTATLVIQHAFNGHGCFQAATPSHHLKLQGQSGCTQNSVPQKDEVKVNLT